VPRSIATVTLLLGASLAACGSGPEAEARSAAWRALVDAELAFAERAAQKGVSAAFLEYLDEDGIVFEPGAVSGREWHARMQSPVGAVLAWRPRLAAVASSGDLGFTTGPWSYRPGAAAEPSAFGDYVSVWRQRAGTWRVALDIGIAHEPPGADLVGSGERAAVLRLGPPPEPGSDAAAVGVRDAEQTLQGRLAAGQPVTEMLDPAVRVFRDRARPDSGRAAFDVLPRPAAVLSWTTQGAAESRAGDLGYTYGIFGADAGDASDEIKGNFLRIWTRDEEGDWIVALDLLNLHPPAPIARR